MKITIEAKAFLTNASSVTPQQLQTEEGVRHLSFFQSDMSAYGFSYIGPATVTVDIPDPRGLVEQKIQSLREEAGKVRADATARCTEIESQIQNLLAIEYTPQ
jgi:hypothetical protein